MKKILLFLLINFTFISNSAACDCEYEGSFFKVFDYNPFVAKVKVIKFLTFKDIYGKPVPMSMQVEIIEIYKGKEKRKSVTVWGDPGNLCRPYLNKFKENQYYIISFSAAGKNENEKITDYAIDNCGAYWLELDVRNAVVSGDIDSKDRIKQTLSFKEFKKRLNTLKAADRR